MSDFLRRLYPNDSPAALKARLWVMAGYVVVSLAIALYFRWTR